jgi:hypothetical protein
MNMLEAMMLELWKIIKIKKYLLGWFQQTSSKVCYKELFLLFSPFIKNENFHKQTYSP